MYSYTHIHTYIKCFNTHIKVLLAAQKMLGDMHGQNIFEQFPIISLQMLHVLLLLCAPQMNKETNKQEIYKEKNKNEAKREPREEQQKNRSVKLKYQFIS